MNKTEKYDSIQREMYSQKYEYMPSVAKDEFMLTTKDNPFSPFTQVDDWLRYDEDHGYYTRNFLARRVVWSDQMSDNDKQLAINEAVLAIVVDPFFSGMYKMVAQKL